jgi:CTP synthase (UTP-ammonia lyase)
MMVSAIRVGILGDFNEEYKSHWATMAAIQHSAEALGIAAERVWIPTPDLLTREGEAEMERCDGLWASPGSPYASFAGMLRGIEFARTRNWPFVGT